MEVQSITDTLNEPQRQAVCSQARRTLVLAGAGSGKTRVLVHRMAYLIESQQVSPFAILAVTFTNKAANEMRRRIETLLQRPIRGMWVGTFHGLSHRLLRAHWQAAQLPESFQILDSDDQHRLIKRVIRGLGLDDKKWEPRKLQQFINYHKDEGQRPGHVDVYQHPAKATQLSIYKAYQEQCDRAGLVDFSELLLRCHELFRNHPDLLKHYQERFQHVLVDEFQDTNQLQYAWLRLLVGPTGHAMIVGDDDQSIYGWRGARVENIQQFVNDDPETVTIRLEQNYRSTQTILAAANQLISHNDSGSRMGKHLWTQGSKGDPIQVYCAFNELDEASYIVGQITAWSQEGNTYKEVAVLYRSNAQSRVIEEALIRQGIPYRVYGGLKFFERAEIKDVLAYLRLVVSRDDDAAFERIINTPTRGIGDATLDCVRNRSREQAQSLWASSLEACEGKLELSARAVGALSRFIELINTLEKNVVPLDLSEQIEYVSKSSGIWDYYSEQRGEKAQAKLENIQELVTAAKQFNPELTNDISPLTSFLTHAALEGGEGQADDPTQCVQLMTLHSAKGLEFSLVFIAGLEEGLFPHQMSFDDKHSLQEERRLCYVGFTRAREKLYLSYAEIRRLYGKEMHHKRSRFIGEIPDDCFESVRARYSAPLHSIKKQEYSKGSPAGDSPFHLGQPVRHKKYGEGVIVGAEGRGEYARVQVTFQRGGSKWLVLAYAGLQTI